jgi:hypothetical protein
VRREGGVGVVVPLPDAVVGAGDGDREAPLALAQRHLDPLGRVDVAHRAGDPARLALGVADAERATRIQRYTPSGWRTRYSIS